MTDNPQELEDMTICIKKIKSSDDTYFYAWVPALGHYACSATGDTAEETLESLKIVFSALKKIYLEEGKSMPPEAAFDWEER